MEPTSATVAPDAEPAAPSEPSAGAGADGGAILATSGTRGKLRAARAGGGVNAGLQRGNTDTDVAATLANALGEATYQMAVAKEQTDELRKERNRHNAQKLAVSKELRKKKKKEGKSDKVLAKKPTVDLVKELNKRIVDLKKKEQK